MCNILEIFVHISTLGPFCLWFFFFIVRPGYLVRYQLPDLVQHTEIHSAFPHRVSVGVITSTELYIGLGKVLSNKEPEEPPPAEEYHPTYNQDEICNEGTCISENSGGGNPRKTHLHAPEDQLQHLGLCMALQEADCFINIK